MLLDPFGRAVCAPSTRGETTRVAGDHGLVHVTLDAEDVDSDNAHSISTTTSRYTAGWYDGGGYLGMTSPGTLVHLALNSCLELQAQATQADAGTYGARKTGCS